MEVDHIFICVQSGAPEAETLKKFGLTEGSSNKHPGQGTENRRFFFKNSFRFLPQILIGFAKRHFFAVGIP